MTRACPVCGSDMIAAPSGWACSVLSCSSKLIRYTTRELSTVDITSPSGNAGDVATHDASVCEWCSGRGVQECDECGGSGIVECEYGHEHDCPECDGEGEVPCDECES